MALFMMMQLSMCYISYGYSVGELVLKLYKTRCFSHILFVTSVLMLLLCLSNVRI